MPEPRELLVAALEEKRPLVLLLGQDAWREGGEEDPVLAKALVHIERDPAGHRGWLQLLDGSRRTPDFYEWLTERFERRVPPDWLRVLGEIPWSAVFTSSLDPTLKRLFSERQRPELVLTSAEMPPAIRSRMRPPIYHLFSHAGSPDPRAQPPLDLNELNARRFNDAGPLLGRILDTATRLGLVLVDGVVDGRDWLRIEDFLGATAQAGRQQIIWFKGRRAPVPGDAGFAAAVSAGRILVADERLSTAITQLRAVPRLADLLETESEEAGKITFQHGRSLQTLPEDRLYIEAAASIVDDAWTAPLIALDRDAEYAAFRRFHGEPGNVRSLVEGVRRGFAIERDYEDKLADLVFAAIEDHASLDAPIVLHGQSATGKSIALARTVARVRHAKTAAVLYSNNRIPQPSEIAEFCHNAEGEGAKATLIVCDTNEDVRLYGELLHGLRSRGHRIVVLGSRYRFIDGEDNHMKTTVEAPTTLSDIERRELSALLKKFANEQVAPQHLTNHHILSFTYRALPLARYRIGSGLSAEASRAEMTVREQRARYGTPDQSETLMAKRLLEAGAGDAFELFNAEQRKAIESDDMSGRIIDLVMAAGSLGCSIPLNLLLRLTGEDHSRLSLTNIAEVFGGLDLFRWEWADNEHNELLVGPRLPLEAELICRRRLGGLEKEADCIIDLIGAVRSVGVDRDHERRFLFNALRLIGPNGPRGSRFRSAYVRIAKTLTDLRTRFGVVDAVLQESTFRRYAVRERAVEDYDTIMTLLTEARDAIQTAIDDINVSRRTRRSLTVELATLYGFIARRHAEAGDPAGKIWSSYRAARSSVRQAASATDSYFPMDVGLWTPTDLLKTGDLADWQRAELAADIYDVLDRINPATLGPDQQERFDVRKFKVGGALDDQELSEAAFADLIERGSTAGCYLRARQLAPDWNGHSETFSSAEREQAKRAAEFLDTHGNLIAQDERSLSLLLECRWISEVGRRPFVGQRQPLPATNSARQLLLDIVAKLNEAAGENPRNVTRYLVATLTWIGRGERVAADMFRELARDTDYEDAGRVIRRHLIADEDGRPKKFEGRVEEDSRFTGSCKVRLEGGSRQLEQGGQVVRLLRKDFPRHDISYGRQVRGFGVAFNFIGPIATPIIG